MSIAVKAEICHTLFSEAAVGGRGPTCPWYGGLVSLLARCSPCSSPDNCTGQELSEKRSKFVFPRDEGGVALRIIESTVTSFLLKVGCGFPTCLVAKLSPGPLRKCAPSWRRWGSAPAHPALPRLLGPAQGNQVPHIFSALLG